MAASSDSNPLLSMRRSPTRRGPVVRRGRLPRGGALAPLCLLLAAACGGPAPPERAWVTPVDAARLVARAHMAMQSGDDEAAFALIDFTEKSQRMLGPIYEEGEPAEQDRLRGLLEAQFVKGWAQHWRDPEAAGEAWYASMSWARPEEARVYLSMPDNPETQRETVELTYSIASRPSGPRIVDRTVSLGGRGSTTTLFVELVKRKATPPDGGTPDLGRVNDVIEELIDEIKIQRIVLGPEHARDVRRAQQAPPPDGGGEGGEADVVE